MVFIKIFFKGFTQAFVQNFGQKNDLLSSKTSLSCVKNSGTDMAEKPEPAYLFRVIYIISPLRFVPVRHTLGKDIL
jgi:hypothetical protein